jgi:hypothetical protein
MWRAHKEKYIMKTPWGTSQTRETIAEGIHSVTTASHGGIMIRREAYNKAGFSSAGRARAMMYGEYYCYEEDCDIDIILFEMYKTAPQIFSEAKKLFTILTPELIKKRLSLWNADYLLAVGEAPTKPECTIWKDRQTSDKMRRERHPDLITSAISTDDAGVVKVTTADGKEHYVTAESYRKRGTLNLLSKCDEVTAVYGYDNQNQAQGRMIRG